MDLTGLCMHVLHALPHEVTGQCMQLLHGLCCFDFVSDIPFLQLLWLWPLTELMRQTGRAVHAIDLSIFLRCLWLNQTSLFLNSSFAANILNPAPKMEQSDNKTKISSRRQN